MDNQFKLKYPKLLLATSLLLSSPVFAEEAAKEQDKEIEVITVSPKGLISYTSASASKSAVPIVENPISISVLTERRLEDLGAITIQDGIGYVAGVYNGPYGVDTRGDWAKIRGVDPVTYLDGLKMLFGHYNNTRTNPYFLQQIEILKGPSSVLFGQGSTGGILNLVSKKPEEETSGEIWAQLGNYNRKQLAADFTGAIDADADVLYRMIGMVRDSETQTDYVDDNTYAFAPSLTWNIGDATALTFLANIQKNESGSSTQFFPHVGTIKEAPNGQIPTERFVSEPGWDKYDTEQKSLTLIAEHDFNDVFSLRAATRYMDSESEYQTMYSANWPPTLEEDGRSMKRTALVSLADAKSWTSDVQLHATFETGIIEHTLVGGVDYQYARTDTDRGYGYGGKLDLYTPTYGYDVGEIAVTDSPEDTQEQFGVYIQDSMKIADHWLVSAALRYDTTKNTTDSADFDDDDSATTGRLGLMYKFDNGLSPYISYSESFQPLLRNDAREDAFDPLEGEQVEFGVKYQPQGTEHLITASYFKIVEKNRKTPSAEDPLLQVQTGEVEIKGIEIEAQLEWDEVDVYSAYTYLDTEITESNTFGQKGAKLDSTPEHQFSTWVTYRPKALDGFKVGLGYRYVGETSDGSAMVQIPNGIGTFFTHRPLKTDSYDLIDMMIGYEFGQFDLSLNVKNLGDETVITSCLARGDCFYGQRRTVTADLRYNF